MSKSQRSSSRRPAKARLWLNSLEQRVTPATFTVLNVNDAGAGSFRQAITDAGATTATDTINFDPTFFNVARTISLLTALPSINTEMSFVGSGSNLLTVERNAGAATSFRIFDFRVDGKFADMNVSGMTIRNGAAVAVTGDAGFGGGILSDENLTLTDCVVTGNSALSGGGIAQYTYGAVTLRNSTISNNVTNGATATTGFGGGLVAFFGTAVKMSNTTFSGNTAVIAGGICLRANNTALIETSTISGNIATGSGGGGIYSLGNPDYSGIVIRNSTIANNTANGGQGGGILLNGNATTNGNNNTIVLQNTTVAGNSAGTGGGIARPTGTGSILLQATVVARNTGGDITGTFANTGTDVITGTNSLVFDQTGITVGGTGNLAAGTDPLFVGGVTPTLANNGGTVQTIALQAASPLINVGLNAGRSGIDARGLGFPRTQTTVADIGSFEFAPTAGIPSALANAADVKVNGGTTYTFTVTYTDIAGTTIGIDTTTFGANDVTANFVNFAGTVLLSAPASFVSNAGNVATYSVAVPGGTFDAADYGRVNLVVNANAVADLNGNFVPSVTSGSALILTGQTFTVLNTADAGAGSLRQAILDANARVLTADTIVFQAGVTGTITLVTGLGIFDPLTITGPGAANLTVSGNNAIRPFITDVEGTGVINISGLTITAGNAGTSAAGGGAMFITPDLVTLDGVVVSNSTAGSGPGGGINIQRNGNVTIRNSTITGNSATNVANTTGNGGGININTDGGTILIENSLISNNTAGNAGGGISDRTGGVVTIRNTTVTGNTAPTGGGIYFGDRGGLLLESSTVSGNTASGGQGGGGVYFYGVANPDGIIIRNSTIFGNTATTAAGGGISTQVMTGNILIQNSTIAGNTAATGGGFAEISRGPGANTIVSTVFAFNTAPTAPDFSGPVTGTNSLIRDQTGTTLTGTGNLAAATNPGFVGGATPTLANNGGTTLTVALTAGSALLNVGSNPATLTTDQRGAGFARTSGAGTDIGAFEVQVATAPQVAGVVVNAGQANTIQRSRVTTLTVTFNAVVTFSGTVAAAFQLSRIGGGAVGGFTASSATVGGVTVVTLTGFTGAETDFGSLADGRYTITALAAQITAGGLQLDGDGNGTGGDNFVLIGNTTNKLFRFFGDVNGDGTLSGGDFGVFRLAFGLPSSDPGYLDFLDFDGNGAIAGVNFGQFRIRFGTSVP